MTHTATHAATHAALPFGHAHPAASQSTIATRGATLAAALGAALRTSIARIVPTPRPRQHAFHHEHILGTSLELQVVATNARVAGQAESAVLDEVERLALVLSGHSPTSELSRWLTTFGTHERVSDELLDVLEAAEFWRVQTDGAFNAAAVSIGELLRDDELATDGDARERAVCMRLRALHAPLWSVDRAHGTACRLTRFTVSLDAVAKGYIVDRAAARAQRIDGVTQVLVNVGGDLRHAGSRALLVGVAHPDAPAENAAPAAQVRLANAALATSGGYRRGHVIDGERVTHIFDAWRGTAASSIASASVFAPDCATADALSTAFSVMPVERSLALADSLPGVGCMLIDATGAVFANATWNDAAVGLGVPASSRT